MHFNKKDLKRLQTLQNTVIRCVFKLSKRQNVDKYHVQLRTLHVENWRLLTILKYMYGESLQLPQPVVQADEIRTRSSNKNLFTPPTPLTDKFRKSFVCSGAVAWNNLTAEEQLAQDIDIFK